VDARLMLATEPCTAGPLLDGWAVRSIRMELRMSFLVGGPEGPVLMLMRSMIGQLVAFERLAPVAAWPLGTPERMALRWCAQRAGWLPSADPDTDPHDPRRTP
jgi:hypothetical protein